MNTLRVHLPTCEEGFHSPTYPSNPPSIQYRSYVRLPDGGKKQKEAGEAGGPRRRLFDLEAGREFEVRVLRVDPSKGLIDLEFVNPEDAVGVPLAEEDGE